MSDAANTPEPRFSQSSKKAFRNPWVVGWLVLLITVFSINALMVGLAIWSNPGLVVNDYYERGKDYEQTINSRLAARNALGWQTTLEMAHKPVVNQPVLFRLLVADKVSQPLRGATIKVHAYRPSDAKADFDQVVHEGVPGQYASHITFPLKGIWDLQIVITRGQDQYDVTRRISVAAE